MRRAAAMLVCAVMFLGCGEPAPQPRETFTGKASYYADSLAGNKTASGEPYDPKQLTAAHPELPFGTKVRVTNLANHKTVVVRINDRGPHAKGRIIDLSRAAAEKIGMIQQGVAKVRVEVVERG